jgi:hypothetical protein
MHARVERVIHLRNLFTLTAWFGVFLSCVNAPGLAADREIFARAYSCEVFDGSGKLFDEFDVTIQPRANETFQYEVEVLSAKMELGKLPTTAKELASGGLHVVSRQNGPNGAPLDAFSPRTGIKLVFEGGPPSSNGYTVIYEDGPSPNFEITGYHPVAAGICMPKALSRE